MSGVGLTITVGGSARSKLGEMIAELSDKGTFFAAASEMMLDQTQQRFKAEAAPDGSNWTPLAPATVADRNGRAHPILQRGGTLLAGIHAAPEANRAVVRTLDLPYAAIHQEGGQAGRGHKVTIPARPYFGFAAEDERDLAELAGAMLLR